MKFKLIVKLVSVALLYGFIIYGLTYFVTDVLHVNAIFQVLYIIAIVFLIVISANKLVPIIFKDDDLQK